MRYGHLLDLFIMILQHGLFQFGMFATGGVEHHGVMFSK